MEVVCVKEVSFMGRVAFEEGEVYTFEKHYSEGELVGYMARSSTGTGVFSKSDPMLKHFMKKAKYDRLNS
jgi:hypothetical protein